MADWWREDARPPRVSHAACRCYVAHLTGRAQPYDLVDRRGHCGVGGCGRHGAPFGYLLRTEWSSWEACRRVGSRHGRVWHCVRGSRRHCRPDRPARGAADRKVKRRRVAVARADLRAATQLGRRCRAGRPDLRRPRRRVRLHLPARCIRCARLSPRRSLFAVPYRVASARQERGRLPRAGHDGVRARARRPRTGARDVTRVVETRGCEHQLDVVTCIDPIALSSQ
mmetsp:Transcript_28991/g.92721  ORF Transcript_28991/g.92721 Transcript_28991/m.92721 type:complete len:226 (+) Transcript_28991:191-868(+)